MTTTNNKYKVIKRSRGSAWNDDMRTKVHMFQYDNTCLPEMFRGYSPFMVNTLLNLGWFADDALTLLNYADATGDHPDWSEDDWDDILYHFQILEATMNGASE